jgi:prophage regulatory protein
MNKPETRLCVTREQLPELIGVTYSRATLLRLEKKGEFPQRYYLSPYQPVWDVAELKAWVEARKAAR